MDQEYKRKLEDAMNTYTTSGVAGLWNENCLMFISNLILAMICLSCIFIVMFEVNGIPSASIAMTITYGMVFTGNFVGLVNKIVEIEKGFISVERI